MENNKYPGQTSFYKGKVRDVYTIDDRFLVMIASNRISAFDVILPRPVPFKGQVLNQIAAYMLQNTADICPNWLLDVPSPRFSNGLKFGPIKKKNGGKGKPYRHARAPLCTSDKRLCGVIMPQGLKENDY